MDIRVMVSSVPESVASKSALVDGGVGLALDVGCKNCCFGFELVEEVEVVDDVGGKRK